MVRDLVSMVPAATEQCHVWPKTAAQDVKCVRVHCRGAGSSRHPVIFQVVFGELIHTNIVRPPQRILVCPSGAYLWCAIPSESKNASNMTFVLLCTWHPFFGCGDVGWNQTLVYDPLHLHRMLAAIIDTFPLRFFRF